MVEREANDFRVLCQCRVNCASQIAYAFAMDDSHLQNPAPLTLGEVIQHQVLHLAWSERVQVQHAVNRQLNWFVVHTRIEPRMHANRQEI